MRLKIYPFLLLIGVSIVAGCSKNSAPKPITPQTQPTTADTALAAVWPTDADVYFVGTASGTNPNNNPIATIWKNGVAQILPNDLSALTSNANAVATNGTDIYVAGDINSMAVYWKNGVFTNLGKGSVQSKALAAAVNANDFYLAGFVEEKAAYWKNGTLNLIARQDSNTVYQANAIAVNGSDIYLAGFSTNIFINGVKAVLWKNGVPTILPDNNSAYALVNAIAVNGTDVYAVGYTDKGATLWKNGMISILSTPASFTSNSANAIIINGSDVYIAGYVGGRATIWKNGTPTILPFDERGSSGYVGLAMDHNDIYAASGVDNAANFIYWKNNSAYQFTKTVNIIDGMVIVPH